ncbi:MAG TPA: hypothetical protein VK440_00855 [Burkholderiales bacterium]|nr:hypothetical protein [Burkholderiales bacterium]
MIKFLKLLSIAAAGVAALVPASLLAQDDAAKEPKLSDHPAVIVSRNWTRADYINKLAIYPHPAEIWWYLHDPRTMDHSFPKKTDQPQPRS